MMKIGRVVCCLCLVLLSLLAIGQPAAVLAQDESEETIEMAATYPSLEETALASFEFEVELKYQGSEARVFDLSTTGPQDWSTYIKPGFEEKRISSIRIEPAKAYSDKVKVVAIPPAWPLAEPGEYQITLEASSGEIKGTIELKSIVTARHDLNVVPTTEGVLGRYNTRATVGKDNYFSVEVHNLSTVALNDISLSSTEKPTGWTVEFSPEKVESLAVGDFQTVEVNIKPSPKTIAGDYYPITIRASAKDVSESMDIRVTVETPTIWGWVGVIIILVVVAGLIFTFTRFSRR
jgi:uncharacterized membrane protein